jgi:GntR family transcriptional regulator
VVQKPAMGRLQRVAPSISLSRRGLKAETARRVRDLLRDDIRSGRFSDGFLPHEPELMVEEGASRNAVRLALDLLRNEGLIERLQGVGTKIVGENPLFMPLAPNIGFAEYLEGGSARVRFDNRSMMVTTAGPGVAGHLDVPPGTDVIFLERVLFIDECPLTLRSSWIPASLAGPIIDGTVDLRQGIFALLEQGLGLELGVTEYSIEATLADEAVGEVMNLPFGTPLLLFESLTRRADGRPAEYGYARIRGDRSRFVTSISRQMDSSGTRNVLARKSL